jgi:hypothetical protein
VLGCLYSSLLGDEERHSAVAFGPGVQQTITACNALIDLMRNESLAARGKEALRRAGALAERRNAVVHGIWATESKSRRMSLQMRYWGKRDVTHWSQEDLEALVEEQKHSPAWTRWHCPHLRSRPDGRAGGSSVISTQRRCE